MRVALATTVMAIAVIAPFSAPALAAGGPSPAQIRTAVHRAEASKALWTTINICNSRRDRDDLGVRGQMPTLGFSAGLSMRIQVEYYSTAKRRFMPIQSSTAIRVVSLGRWSKNLQQAGAEFPFKAHAGLLSATIQFTWRRGSSMIGQVTRAATGGHRGADYSSPPHYSAAQCRIP